jgi:microcystin-dependent protein
VTFTYPNPIEPLTPADAAEVQDNNDDLVGYLNTEVITRDGRVRMAAPLQLVDAEPVSADDATRKSYVDALLPVGTMMMYGSMNPPAGRWKLCDGSTLQSAAFPVLFGVLGYSYGGSGGTFKLPDLRHRVPIGVDTGVTRFSTAGKTGGSWLVPVPSHTHGIDHNHGQFNSGVQSAGHTHKITHDHPGHAHSGRYSAHANPGSGGFYFLRRTDDTAGTIVDTAVNPFDIPSFVGDSGSQSASHTHPVNMPNFAGNSEAYKLEIQIDNDPVTKTTTEHVPPYVVVTYIIRTD